LILSLKRFDLDYTTFETVKLNSRCAFGQTLNMKRYTLEGLEATEAEQQENQDGDAMDTGNEDNSTKHMLDEDYEYKLAGVLVHAGVAQGGHYYSFIKDRSEDKWYRFDDDDVTPFDPASIEVECFGGKVKKETKWPNGQVHTVESEQYANALMLFYEKVKMSEQPPFPENTSTKKPNSKDIRMSSGYDAFEPDVRRSNATHRWQSFLFDTEFQLFLKGLLGLCQLASTDSDRRMDVAGNHLLASMPQQYPRWRQDLIQMLLTFLFDVLLYSNERHCLGEWVEMIESILISDLECAREFTYMLASKSVSISGNWLRTYLLDCPDQTARLAGVRVFSRAIQSCLMIPDEQRKLEGWVGAWKKQVLEGIPVNFPCYLQNQLSTFEDVTASESSLMSGIGAILSLLNELIDNVPRSWRFSPELCMFIRNVSSIDAKAGGDLIRNAMIECLIPARLICIIGRNRVPNILKAAFPAATVPIEVAETQIRPEQNPHSHHHLMPMTGNQGLNPSDMNYRGGSPMDYLSAFEAIGCLMGIPGIINAPLIVEHDDQGRGRQRIVLTDSATRALREIFQEWCAESAPGMGQREIEVYLHRSGLENVSPQKIVDMMAKYPTTTTSGNGTKGVSYLSLEGFLAYYRDCSQSNETKVRHDLHMFGFRPDLSRRPSNARHAVMDGQEQHLPSPCESVAYDVYSIFKDNPPNIGKLAGIGLSSFRLYEMAANVGEQVGEYVLAGAFVGKNLEHCSPLIYDALKVIYQGTVGWISHETVPGAIFILRVLASIPDEYQNDRINLIMQFSDGAQHDSNNSPIGLIVAARHLYSGRAQQSYSHDVHYAYERYVGYLRELLGVHCIIRWMHDNRGLWSWMERDIYEVQHQAGPVQSRGDYSMPREPDDGGIALDHHHHSDSDGMPGIHDSEDEEDEDSRLEEMELYQDGPSRVIVTGAGKDAVNGTYTRDGVFEKAFKFSRPGEYKGKNVIFSLFKCNVSNNTKHWYISIIPSQNQPGTSSDVDFYSAPATDDFRELPPLTGWLKAVEGEDPPPFLTLKPGLEDSDPIPVPPFEDNIDGDVNEGPKYV